MASYDYDALFPPDTEDVYSACIQCFILKHPQLDTIKKARLAYFRLVYRLSCAKQRGHTVSLPIQVPSVAALKSSMSLQDRSLLKEVFEEQATSLLADEQNEFDGYMLLHMEHKNLFDLALVDLLYQHLSSMAETHEKHGQNETPLVINWKTVHDATTESIDEPAHLDVGFIQAAQKMLKQNPTVLATSSLSAFIQQVYAEFLKTLH